MPNTLSTLMSAIDTQLKLQGFSNDCHCPSCNTLKPLYFALMQAREEVSAENYRVFCAAAQAQERTKESARQVAKSGGALAQAYFRGDGRVELWVSNIRVRVFDMMYQFAAYAKEHNLQITFM